MHGFVHSLLELRRYAGKGRVKLRTKPIHNRNDCNGNTGGDQAVFNRRCSRLILPKPDKKLIHDDKPLGVVSRDQAGRYRALSCPYVNSHIANVIELGPNPANGLGNRPTPLTEKSKPRP